jgi:hypothetical protein
MHDIIISLRDQVCSHETSVTPPLSIEVPARNIRLQLRHVIIYYSNLSMTLKPSTPFYRANITQIITSVWRNLNILKFKFLCNNAAHPVIC